MNFQSLHYFTIVAEEMNITKAAERLIVSQQALSKSILRLEDELGIKLFNRKPEFSLTYSGKMFYEASKNILGAKDRIIDELNEINEEKSGIIRIGITDSRSEMLLPLVMDKFIAKHSDTKLRFIQGTRKYIDESLKNDEVDVLIDFMPIMVDDVTSHTILTEKFYLVVPKEMLHNMYPDSYDEVVSKMKEHVDLSYFKDCPFMLSSHKNRSRRLFEQYAIKQGIELRILAEIDSNTTSLLLACKGLGITIYSKSFTCLHPEIFSTEESPVEIFLIDDHDTFGDLAIAYKKTKHISTALKDFIDITIKATEHYRS